ncbi:hypothetical protein CPB84DRAFT_1763394 [Gymnopilus junonius]|uniref:Uncharacterized protein n=1 Tax=Gymnopilus junonius TaxID=109634 RepID=A0A9P5TSG5_GYMJU|nr:hypothetical protein CPB84DRAFT_1763394 [Gymnopilus junonius]
MSETKSQEALKDFITQKPQSQYTFDSERDSSASEICRNDGQENHDCITLQMNAKKLFESMQNLGFFCAMPIDPARTYMACKPLRK